MWLYLKNAFYSIVADPDSKRKLIVRARLAGDIERHFPEAEVREYSGTDYRYRASLLKTLVAETLQNQIADIGYEHFQAAAQRQRREHLRAVYNTMRNTQAWQELLETTKQNNSTRD